MQLKIEWAANPAAEQVTSYNVHVKRDAVPVQGSPFQVTGTSHTIDNPQPGVYTAQVIAVNIAGTSPTSDTGSGPGIPSKPGTPTVTVIP